MEENHRDLHFSVIQVVIIHFSAHPGFLAFVYSLKNNSQFRITHAIREKQVSYNKT